MVSRAIFTTLHTVLWVSGVDFNFSIRKCEKPLRGNHLLFFKVTVFRVRGGSDHHVISFPLNGDDGLLRINDPSSVPSFPPPPSPGSTPSAV
jgi:hypothetical protein